MPANVAVICFFTESVTRSLGQVGFMLQKLAHRDLEEKAPRADNVNDLRQYCSVKWFLGLSLIIITSASQSLVLPYIDMMLISCNAATAIIVNMILSTRVLGEQFIWKYDLTAMFFIFIGSLTIVL